MFDSINKKDSGFARLWLQDNWKSTLIESIHQRNKDTPVQKKITERQLIEEYFRQSQLVPETDKMRLIIHQVGLTKQDYDKVQDVISKTKISQLKYGAFSTLGTYALYKLVLAKRKTFYNFFRKQHRFAWIGHFKRGFSFFTLFVVQVNLWNLGFEKTIPNDLFKEGMYKRYHVEYEKTYL